MATVQAPVNHQLATAFLPDVSHDPTENNGNQDRPAAVSSEEMLQAHTDSNQLPHVNTGSNDGPVSMDMSPTADGSDPDSAFAPKAQPSASSNGHPEAAAASNSDDDMPLNVALQRTNSATSLGEGASPAKRAAESALQWPKGARAAGPSSDDSDDDRDDDDDEDDDATPRGAAACDPHQAAAAAAKEAQRKNRRNLLPTVPRQNRCGQCHTCLNPQACAVLAIFCTPVLTLLLLCACNACLRLLPAAAAPQNHEHVLLLLLRCPLLSFCLLFCHVLFNQVLLRDGISSVLLP
jgi:hypothetical protein